MSNIDDHGRRFSQRVADRHASEEDIAQTRTSQYLRALNDLNVNQSANTTQQLSLESIFEDAPIDDDLSMDTTEGIRDFLLQNPQPTMHQSESPPSFNTTNNSSSESNDTRSSIHSLQIAALERTMDSINNRLSSLNLRDKEYISTTIKFLSYIFLLFSR